MGVKSQDIVWDASKIIKIKQTHPAMTDEIIKQVPSIIENPIIVMDSKTVPGRITIFGELADADGAPVLVALELAPTKDYRLNMDVIKIASAYGKGTNPQKLLNESRVLFVEPDKNRTHTWLKLYKLQLPSSAKYGLSGRVSYKINSVKNSIRSSGIENAKFSIKDMETVYGDSYNSIKRKGMRGLFNAAKAGDVKAAGKLVPESFNNASLDSVKAKFKGCTLIPVVRSTPGSNVIPQTLARYVSEKTGLALSETVRLTSEIQKKAYGKFPRMFAKSVFNAEADLTGLNAVIVDDVISSGGTAAELAAFLQSNGATVKGAISLFRSKNATDKLGITQEQIDQIWETIGENTVEDALGRRVEDLSFREAETILNNRGSFVEPELAIERIHTVRYSIKEGMSEAERYEELKDAGLTVALYDADASKLTPTEVERLEMATRRDARRYVKELYEKFDVGKRYANRAAEIEFVFGDSGYSKSIHEQTARGNEYAPFGKMLTCFDEVVENAVPLDSIDNSLSEDGSPNSDAADLYGSNKRSRMLCVTSRNAAPALKDKEGVFDQMSKSI